MKRAIPPLVIVLVVTATTVTHATDIENKRAEPPIRVNKLNATSAQNVEAIRIGILETVKKKFGENAKEVRQLESDFAKISRLEAENKALKAAFERLVKGRRALVQADLKLEFMQAKLKRLEAVRQAIAARIITVRADSDANKKLIQHLKQEMEATSREVERQRNTIREHVLKQVAIDPFHNFRVPPNRR